MSPQERRARAGLCRVLEPDDEEVGALRARAQESGPEAFWAALAGEDPVPGLDPGALVGARARRRTADPDRDLGAADALGLRFVVPGDDEWPAGLDDLGGRAPFGLYVRGAAHLRQVCSRSVAVVGARAASPYGERVAVDLGHGLVEAGWTVVSGAAFGIDAAAHHGALVAGGPTVAVLACGAEVAYPRAHEGLLGRIAADGAVVSEHPPGSGAHRHRFLSRNRLIAAMTAGTVVVEAAVRSGALSTARHAAGLLRPVLAVPGPVGSALSEGPLLLLREYAAVAVGDAGQVLETVAAAGEALAVPPRAQPVVVAATDGLSAPARRLVAALPVHRGHSTTRLAGAAGVGVDEARRLLPVLEIDGLVDRADGGWRRGPSLRGLRVRPVRQP